MESIISIKNVSFSYSGGVNVLENLSFDIYKKDFIAIIGANGSGKSTLLKLILKELNPSDGEIFISNTNIKNFKEWDTIGYVPQINAGNIPGFPITALEIVTLNLYNKMGFFKFSRKSHIELAKRALSQVNMLDFANTPMNKMSGGQQQRIMIAKSLINNPKILIFDEPTTGIDKESKDQLFKILTHLNRIHGITILLVTHELEIMKDNLTKVVEIRDKKVVVR
ncbi:MULTISPECIES: metal ABC transporter ATP-binding protein [Parvimonas]|uniref:Metal ABC transporter ATP-binding protein n=1 Tax=Parvimonas micra TaxID=33033 RepID=A0A9X3H9W1_9FIRM|nr:MULTISPECIES: metal ABC transporter ATP-binding protein [Parvimonas]MCZ7407435.1 metal ABC transporter ATP-binding protein [Parvimonas micra]MCZ7410214.1 metal ABC transporter ATP-binding protein [Parvimonas micra]MCZ7412043.1 metal ABC transporter ATP-binding protein [Parvimonas micra]MEB3058691.1 metal ABC transporter ATP-binding protein [Parvimonas sp. D9]WBB31006.1 metal ABC transporter ATP-binding protein [Parvimonas micra]